MTTRLASDEPHILRSDTIGGAWSAVAGRIVASGVPSRYDDLPIREISLVTLAVMRPDPDDEVIARHAEPERLAGGQRIRHGGRERGRHGRRPPQFLRISAARCAREAPAGFGRCAPLVFPGRAYRMAMRVLPPLPRGLRRRQAAQSAERFRRASAGPSGPLHGTPAPRLTGHDQRGRARR